MPKSIFAKALKSLLDETNLFSREGWAEILGITEDNIDGWVADRCFPDVSHLRKILGVVYRKSVKKDPFKKFEELYGENLFAISSSFSHKKGTLWYFNDLRLGEYTIFPALDGFLGSLRVLPLVLQEKFLYKFAEECREARELKPVSREDGEKAFAILAKINNVNIEEMRNRIKKISEDVLREMNEKKSDI